MKKLFALIMAVCLVTLCLTPAMAEEKNLLTVSGPATCAPGSTFTMAFGLVAGTKAQAVNVEVSYDTDTFAFVDYENGDLIGNAIAAGNGDPSTAGGKFLFTFACMEPMETAGVLFTITFKVDSKATGSHDFYFYSSTFNVDDGTSAGKDLEPNALKQTVTVEGSSVSSVVVTPAYDDYGNVVSAQAGENKTIVTVDGTPANGSSVKGGKLSPLATVGIVVGIAVLIVGFVLILLAIGNRKVKKEKERKEAPMKSILDDEAKAFLNMEEDALENKDDKE